MHRNSPAKFAHGLEGMQVEKLDSQWKQQQKQLREEAEKDGGRLRERDEAQTVEIKRLEGEIRSQTATLQLLKKVTESRVTREALRGACLRLL